MKPISDISGQSDGRYCREHPLTVAHTRKGIQMSYDSSMRKRAAVKSAEASGEVADSMDIRLALMSRVHSGEITLAQAQAELAKIKRGAKASGKVTRSQAFRHG